MGQYKKRGICRQGEYERDCVLALVLSSNTELRMRLPSESSHSVVLKTYDVPQLAHLDKAKLADEGIKSFIQDENIVTAGPYLSNAVGYIKLLVLEQDVAKAREILALNEFDSLRDVFDDRLDPQMSCPTCGSIDVIQRKSIVNGLLFLILFFMPVAVPTKHYVCAQCGYQWKSG